VTERRDSGRLKTVTRIFIFDDPDGSIAKQLQSGASIERFLDKLREVKTVEGNVFLNEGINFIWLAVTGATGLTYFDGSHAYIGVGDGSTTEDPTQTGLQGTNKTYKLVDSGYPQVSGNIVKFRATFGPDEGNHAWKEWTVANGNSDAAVNLNRKVQDLGTKASGTTWTIEVQLQIT
jgi:hypothetical protein